MLSSHFESLLETLGDQFKHDHLRLPLQVAVLLSPIFLLHETQIHKSRIYCQRYKMMLVCEPFLTIISCLIFDHKYSKCLGNERPKSVIQFENVIWKAIFQIACGAIDVYQATDLIATAIPGVMAIVEDGDASWFNLGLSLYRTSFKSH